MDDITVMTPPPSIYGAKWILNALEKMASWAQMMFKPEKSRSLCIVKGKVTSNIFTIQRPEVPTIQSQQIRCLGKTYGSSFKDCNSWQNALTQLKAWLKTIDSSHLLDRFKVWSFRYSIIPRLQWPFLLYNFPTTQGEAMNGLCSKFVRKSLGVRPACSLVNLYRSSKLYLPVTSVVEEYKAAKVKAVTTLFLSKDKKISHSSFQEMEASGFNQGSQDILEAPGDCCCDMLRKTWWNNAVGGIMPMTKAKQYLVVKRERRETAEMDCWLKAMGLSSQGQWMQ